LTRAGARGLRSVVVVIVEHERADEFESKRELVEAVADAQRSAETEVEMVLCTVRENLGRRRRRDADCVHAYIDTAIVRTRAVCSERRCNGDLLSEKLSALQ